jgi:hypothetical protein
MRECNKCKLEFDETLFVKLTGTYFKLCVKCREIARIHNNKRKEKKSSQAKEYYQQYKDEIKNKNKEYREKNREKLNIYDRSPERRLSNKIWLKQKRQEDPCRFIFYSAKHRSQKTNILFDLTYQDIIDAYPKDNLCPILGIHLVVNEGKTKDNSPSLDRIIPEHGYVKKNIVIISYRANRIKNNATVEELIKIINFLEGKGCI